MTIHSNGGQEAAPSSTQQIQSWFEYLSFTQVIWDEPHQNGGGANVSWGRGYSYRSSVVACQGQVKGHRGHRKSPVHLNVGGCHTGKALDDDMMEKKKERWDKEAAKIKL